MNALLTSLLVVVLTSNAVEVRRVPDGGIQPQAVVDAAGQVHLIYFKGDPARGDVFYVRFNSADGSFSLPLRVNSMAGSAVAVGNIRGAHLALGRNGRAHVAWMGSQQAPKVDGESPMLYSRIDESRTKFEPERNVITKNFGLDGGGSVAADGDGNVYVVWHAGEPGKKGEEYRRVWVARSHDEGATFEPESTGSLNPTGACGCCGMRAFCDAAGTLFILYRGATQTIHRDMFLVTTTAASAKPLSQRVAEWQVGKCIMSTSAFAPSPSGTLASWETEGQVYWGRLATAGSKPPRPIAAPGGTGNRKYPVVAADAEGRVLLAWTEGMGWNQGGAAAWQVFDAAGKPVPGEAGRVPGVPVWSLVAAWPKPDGGFVVMY